MHPPYTEDEAREARLWVNKHGPSNSWTAGGGTAARMIGRLLKERERLMLSESERDAVLALASYCETQLRKETSVIWRATMTRISGEAREAMKRTQ